MIQKKKLRFFFNLDFWIYHFHINSLIKLLFFEAIQTSSSISHAFLKLKSYDHDFTP